MSDIDIEAELAHDDNDGDSNRNFSIPQESISNQLNKVEIQDEKDNKAYVSAVMSMLRAYEYQYLKRRYKSFDLIQNEELCDRYYRDTMSTIEKEGVELSIALSSTNDITSREAVRKVAQTFVNLYIPIKQKTQNVSYPWPTYDDDVQLSCLSLMQRNEVPKCKSYMLGYLETVCRIPVVDQSEQGKIFTNSIAWATGRHPFGSYFTKVVIALKNILRRVRLELCTGEMLCSRIKIIIEQTTQMWLWSWSKFEIAKLQTELSELLLECFQHIVFLAIPTLSQVFLNTSSYMMLHATDNPFQRQNTSFRACVNVNENSITKGGGRGGVSSLSGQGDAIESQSITYRVVDSRVLAVTQMNTRPDSDHENVRLIVNSINPTTSISQPVIESTLLAVPVSFNTNEMMYEGDIVIANATVVDTSTDSNTIQSRIDTSSTALQTAYSVFTDSYSSAPQVARLGVPTPSVTLTSATTTASNFNRIIGVEELMEICGVPHQFRPLLTHRRDGMNQDTSVHQVSCCRLVSIIIVCHYYYYYYY